MKTLVVGDVHGCVDELRELVGLAGVRPGTTRVVSVGDLVDRGPDPVGAVRTFRENGWEAVLGNHEEKALRWLRYEDRRKSTGQPNPMRPPPEERRQEWLSLSEDDRRWLSSLPITERVGEWIVVHAGLEPGRPLDGQKADRVIRVRYVNEEGEMVPYADGSLEQPPDTVYWTEKWRGPDSVMYGHAVHSMTDPRTDMCGKALCVGIDTGCVFGGRLTGVVVDGPSFEFVQVRARREYFKAPGYGTLA